MTMGEEEEERRSPCEILQSIARHYNECLSEEVKIEIDLQAIRYIHRETPREDNRHMYKQMYEELK